MLTQTASIENAKLALDSDGGLLVNMLALYSDDSSSNPAEVYHFSVKGCLKRRYCTKRCLDFLPFIWSWLLVSNQKCQNCFKSVRKSFLNKFFRSFFFQEFRIFPTANDANDVDGNDDEMTSASHPLYYYDLLTNEVVIA